MPKNFYQRLREYYEHVGEALRGEASASAIFPNSSDVGAHRERIYAEFLQNHLPSSCNIMYGGFLFNIDGDESKQLDLIISNSTSPQYKMADRDSGGKSFACIEGCLAVVSVKSTLDTKQLHDALKNIASVPEKQSIDEIGLNPQMNLPNYEDWPYKIIYASDGISSETLQTSLKQFYDEHPDIPYYHRPNLIHVGGKYNIIRIFPEGCKNFRGEQIPAHTFYLHSDQTDFYALQLAVQHIQKNATASQHILFSYDMILNNLINRTAD
ncbi:MAG: hypothetical protein QM501_08485 [Gimesia sp.]